MAGPPKGKKKKSGAAAAAMVAQAPDNRVKSAKAMREQFHAIKASPEGFNKGGSKDPQKMDLTPACIECTHCRFPVYVKDAAIATDKTFERMEMKLGAGAKKELEEKKKAEKAEADQERALAAQAEEDDIFAELMGGLEKLEGDKSGTAEEAKAEGDEEEGDEEEEEDEDLDTVEQLERKVEDMEEKIDSLENQVDELEEQKQELQDEVKQLKEDLEVAKDRISFLEESEMRWRDKYRNAMSEMEVILLNMERVKMKGQDAENTLVRMRTKVGQLTVRANVKARRRNGLLVQLWRSFKKYDKDSMLYLMINLWRPWARMTRVTRERDDQERQYREDCYGRCWQVIDNRAEIARLWGIIARNEACRWQGGQQRLAHLFSAGIPWILARPFNAWRYAHPTVKKENAFDRLTVEHTKLGRHCKEVEGECKKANQDLQQEKRHVESLKKLNEEGFKAIKDVEDKAKREAAQSAKEAKRKLEDALAQAEEKAEAKFTKASEGFAEIQANLEDQIESLQDALDVFQFGQGGSKRRGDKRVVPRGKGILCLGCLRQLMHRDAQPLPPVEAYTCSAEHILNVREQYFDDAFRAALNPKDDFMNHQWKKANDPAGITPLSGRPVTSEAKDRDLPEVEKHEMKRPRSLASLNRPESKGGPPLRRVVWR